jgi:phospholipid N-methyltransferase
MEKSSGAKKNCSNKFLNLRNDPIVEDIYKELIEVEMEFFDELEKLFNNDKVLISDIEDLKEIEKLKRKNVLNKLISYIKSKAVGNFKP